MKWVKFVETRDGKLHPHALRAGEHAEKVYGEALSALAHRAVIVEKYSKMMEFIDANLDAFIALKALKQDTILETDEDE